ncbi:MAG: MerR family transcriptional regulator, partial [Rubrobacter sp.]|nr:MerR family transcriptional regulator [Rubrobacter sp.]
MPPCSVNRGDLSRIGEVADRLGVSPRTIKYYEEIGLLIPGER